MSEPTTVGPSSGKRGTCDRITLEMASSLDIEKVIETIAVGLVDDLDAAFARIWLLGPGDLCDECYKAADCENRERCLHLKCSAGMYTNLNGEFRRVPLGALKIGRIAQGWGPMCTNDVLKDERLPNKAWMKENGLRSFAGYPLKFREELLGVVAMFSRRAMSEEEFDLLAVFAHQAAIAIKNAQLFSEVERLKVQLEAENVYLQEEIKLEHNFDEIVGKSSEIINVLKQVEQVAPTDSTVLILGETGTGKELIARALHNLSPRRDRPLVKVNCGAISAGLVESELFGHERGAFTGALQQRIGRFELAHGGTIFLDEVGEMPAESQVKLLRVLQEHEFERVGSSRPRKVDVRVIAATNRNIAEAVQVGTFRSDLFYRLNVFPVEIPPLRKRKEDIPLMVKYFLARFSKRLGKQFKGVSKDSLSRLTRYAWPGNIRELENVLERAAVLGQGPTLHLDKSLGLGPDVGSQASGPRTLEEMERAHIRRTLEEINWVIEGQQGGASILGLHPNTLRSRMQKLGIKKPHRSS